MKVRSMNICFIGETFYSALCLESIFREVINIDEVLTTKDRTDYITRIAQTSDVEVMKRKGFERDFYGIRSQRFIERALRRITRMPRLLVGDEWSK